MTDDHGALTPSERKAARTEVRPDLSKRKRWRWLSDGQLHEVPPPADDAAPEPVTMEAPPPAIPTEDRNPQPRTAPAVIERPPVPVNFAHTERTRLRLQALEFALRGGELLRARVGSGAEILAEAEQIERWIAEPLAGKTDGLD